MDELRQSIADLEIQEGEIERKLGNAETDEEARQITNDLNLVRNRLSEKREELRQQQEKEQQRAEVIEEKAHSAEIPFAVAGIDFTGLAPEVITLIDLVVKADRRRLLNEHAIEMDMLDEEARKNGETIEKLRRINDDNELIQIDLNRQLDEYRVINSVLQGERDEARQNRDNAARLLEDANAENARLKSELEDLKRAQEYNNRQSEKFNANDDEKATINAAVEAVKKLYVKVEDWGSVQKVIKEDGSFELATRQQVADEWQAADVPDSFRNADHSAEAEVAATQALTPLEPPISQFQTEEPAISEHVLHGAVAQEGTGEVTRAEFDKLRTEVMTRLYDLEVKVHGVDFVDTGDAA